MHSYMTPIFCKNVKKQMYILSKQKHESVMRVLCGICSTVNNIEEY